MSEEINKKELSLLNPQIKEVEIGIRNLRKIKVYPLSLSDQFKFTSTIVNALQGVYKEKEQDNFVFAEVIRSVLANKLEELLVFVTDKEEKDLLSEISNIQALEIAEIIYEVNYQALEKKMKFLMEKLNLKNLFQLPKLQQPFSEDILNTDSNISIKRDLEKEELPLDNLWS